MKLKYLGTGAAEGVPAIFCRCNVCKESKRLGKRNLRTRSQAIINNEVLIEFNNDAYYHFREYDLPYNDIEHLLITHSHDDHWQAEDVALRMKGYSNGLDKPLIVYGTEKVHKYYNIAFGVDKENRRDNELVKFCEINPFVPFSIYNNKYKVTPLLADHDKRETCVFYQILQNDNKQSLLYAHDTGFFPSETWEYWENLSKTDRPLFGLVSLDCNSQAGNGWGNHMGLTANIAVKEKMEKLGLTNQKTIWVCNHFSHNGGLTYDQMEKLATKAGFLTSYDGMEIVF